ncbi:hypothetical protein D3C71_1865400 [compost metagenome]
MPQQWIPLPHTRDPEKHQGVTALETEDPVVTKVAAEHKTVATTARLQQIVAGTTNQHVIAQAPDQMIVAVLSEQPVATGVRREGVGTAIALHR